MRVGAPISVAAVAVAALISGCGSEPPPPTQPISSKPANAKTQIVLGSRGHGEQLLIADIYAGALRQAGFRVRLAPAIGSPRRALAALRRGELGAYPENQTAAITTLFGLRPEEVPTNAESAHKDTREDFLAEGIRAYPPTLFSSARTLALLAGRAARLELGELSDLGDLRRIVVAAPPDCRRQLSCLVAIDEGYGLRLGRVLHVPESSRYSVLRSRRANFSVVGSTDGQLAAPSRFVALADDRAEQPPGNLALLVNRRLATRAGPQLGAIVRRVQERLGLATIRKLNARVELGGRPPARVATAYLRRYGLID